MNVVRSTLFAVIVGGLVLAAGPGCGGSTAPTRTESVETVVTRAGTAMQAVTTLRFEMSHTGADVLVGGAGRPVAFRSAKGRFAAPSSAEAVIEVRAGTVTAQVGAIAIDGTIWLTDPLTGRWAAAPDAFQFDPARIFRADVGLGKLLSNGLSQAKLTSTSRDGDGRFHVTARVSPARVSTLTSGLIEDVEDAEFWIDGETYLLDEMRFAVPVGSGDTRWTLRLSDYGAPVTIDRPTIG